MSRVFDDNTYFETCRWCDEQFPMVFVWRIRGVSRFQGEHYCRSDADNPMVITVRQDRQPPEGVQ